MSIAAESADLNNLIQRDEYRRLLNETSEQYERMGQFISNLESDIRSIDDAVRMLDMQQRTGYDIGDSKETLGFQRNTLQSDLNFYLEQRRVYLTRCFESLYKFSLDIARKAIVIEPNSENTPDDERLANKLAGMRSMPETEEEASTITISDSFSALSVCERNLVELSSDIASFDDLIRDAERKAARGFHVANLSLQLKQQQMLLETSFRASITRLAAFLSQNLTFAKKALKRIEGVAAEILTQDELNMQNNNESSEETTQPEEE